MNILCCCLRAAILTGSELYFFELSDALSDLGHNVTLVAEETSALFFEKINRKFELKNFKDFKINKEYDLIILSHYKTTYKYISELNIPIINVVHSEIYESEVPLLSNLVKKYVGIRPSICEKIESFGIDRNKIQLIRNPINLDKFNTEGVSDQKFGLFVGTMGGVRQKAALHFAQFCYFNNLKSIYISAENQKVDFFNLCLPSCTDVEKYFKSCTISGGVIQGRTYFEAKLCGKPTIEYYINNFGQIIGIDYEDAPDQEELKLLQNHFDKHEVAKRIIEV